jgi:hypothetical protein
MYRHILTCIALISYTLLASGCGGGGGGGDSDDSADELEVDIEAVTVGDWYRPTTDATWTWQLQGTLNTSYDTDIYDIDLFDTDKADITSLQAAGRKVICYFSAGSYEDFREDKDQFSDDVLGNTLSGFDDERWLDIRVKSVYDIMLSRLDLAVDKGCDGVEPDNVMVFEEDSGFSVKANDQLGFNRNLFNAAHERGLSVALKNDLSQIDELVDYADMIVNEQCHEFDECEQMKAFLDAGKPVLNAEYLAAYQADPSAVCADAIIGNWRTLILSDSLDDSFKFSCDQD